LLLRARRFASGPVRKLRTRPAPSRNQIVRLDSARAGPRVSEPRPRSRQGRAAQAFALSSPATHKPHLGGARWRTGIVQRHAEQGGGSSAIHGPRVTARSFSYSAGLSGNNEATCPSGPTPSIRGRRTSGTLARGPRVPRPRRSSGGVLVGRAVGIIADLVPMLASDGSGSSRRTRAGARRRGPASRCGRDRLSGRKRSSPPPKPLSAPQSTAPRAGRSPPRAAVGRGFGDSRRL